jgi:Amt family ammonium transporter
MALKVLPALGAGLLVALVVPGLASADSLEAYNNGVLPDSVGFNTLWVIVAGMVVMFMQAGFKFLEIGFSRQKNAGTIVAKVLTNFSIAAICWYFVGFAFAFGSEPGSLGGLIGGTGFMLQNFGDPTDAFPVMGLSNALVESKFFFQFVFCAVSLALVWGTTLERITFGV